MAYLRQWKSGTYALQWKNDDGDMQSESTKTKDLNKAKRFLRNWNADKKANEDSNKNERIRLVDAIEQYKDDITVGTKTKKLVKISLNHLIEVVGNHYVDRIAWRHRAKLRKHLNNQYARTTVNLRNRQIKSFFLWLVNESRYLDKVPFTIVMERIDEEYLAFTPEDIAEMHSFVDDPVIAAWFRFARSTGYRLDEINKAFINDKGRIEAKGKRGKRRVYPLYDYLVDDWDLIKGAKYPSERVSKACTMAWRKVLISRHTDHKDVQDMGKEKLLRLVRPILYKEYAKKNGIKVEDFTNQQKREAMCTKRFHSFRHTWAEELYDETNDIYYVSKAIGHSSVAVTQKYEKADVIKKLEERVRQPLAQS
jgi:integrase